MSNLHPIFEELLAPFAPNDEDRFLHERPLDPTEELIVAGYGRQGRLLQDCATTMKRMLRDWENGRLPRPEEWSAIRCLVAKLEGKTESR